MSDPEVAGITDYTTENEKKRSERKNSFHERNLSVLANLTAARKAREVQDAKESERKKTLLKNLQRKVLSRVIDDDETRPELPGGAQSRPGPQKRSTGDAFEDWKRKNRIPATSRVFIIKGGYLDLKRGLEKRGWAENKDTESEFFDLKWTLNAKDIDYEKLNEKQIVNHFVKNREITTKIGLTKNLKYESTTESETFFPRSFDLSDYGERLGFVDYFKLNKAVSILKLFKSHVDSKANMTYSYKVVSTAIAIVKRSLTDVDDALDIPSLAESIGKTSENEWKILRFVSLVSPEELTDDGENLPGELDRGSRSPSKRASIPAKLANGELAAAVAEYERTTFVDEVGSLLQVLEEKDPQFKLNGTRNMWIVKPAGKSRGRGVELKRNLLEISHALTSGLEGELLVVQKYIENPQIIEGYKFDIRQWVLVTDWNPLTIYIWKQPYIRFASEKFDKDYKSSSAYVHLVNNSINKNNPHFHESNAALKTDDYMWFRQDYEHWLHKQTCNLHTHNAPFLIPPPYTSETMRFDLEAALKGEYGVDFQRPESPAKSGINQTDLPESAEVCEDTWTDKIAPQIRDIVVSSLWSVMDSIEHRKGSCELYGYDFMVTEDNKVWLIEVNSSPAMDYSTHVTTPLIKIVLDDTAAILTNANSLDTGEWTLAFKGPNVTRPLQAQRLQVDGTSIKRPSLVPNPVLATISLAATPLTTTKHKPLQPSSKSKTNKKK